MYDIDHGKERSQDHQTDLWLIALLAEQGKLGRCTIIEILVAINIRAISILVYPS